MDLSIYFKPIDKIEIKNKTIGSVTRTYLSEFPDWESLITVFISVHENRGANEQLNNDNIVFQKFLHDLNGGRFKNC